MRRWGTIGLILWLSFGIRMVGLPAIRHNYDHSLPIIQAALWREQGIWPTLGPRTSFGIHASPLVSLLLVPVLAVGPGPWLPHYTAVALDTLAVALLYRTARSMGPAWLARVAALVAAFSPWHIYLARGTWIQGWFPFFIALALWSWSPFLIRGRSPSPARIGWGWAGVTLAALTHPVGLLLLPPALLTAGQMPGNRWARSIGAGLMLTVVLAYGWTAWRAWEGPRTSWLPARLWPWHEVAFAHALRMISGRHFAAVWMDAASPLDRLFVSLSDVIAGLIETSVALGVLGSIARGLRQRLWHLLLLPIWWGFPTVWLALPWPHPIHPHYLLPTMPAGVLLAIRPWQKLPARSWGRYLIEAGMWGAVFIWVLILLATDRNARVHPWTGNPEELPLAESATLAQRLIRWMEEDPRVQVVIPSEAAETTSGWLIGLIGRPVDIRRGFHPERLAVAHPHRPTLMLLYGQGDPPILRPLQQGPSWIHRMPDGAWLALYEILPEEILRKIRPSIPTDTPTDLGWRLLGYDLEQGDNRLAVITYWQVERIPTDPTRGVWHYQPFHHLLDPEGRQLQNPSGWGMPGYLWRIGDIYVERTELIFPGDASQRPIRLELGLFDPNRNVRARFLLPTGETETLILKVWK